jgi:hypothetical protein
MATLSQTANPTDREMEKIAGSLGGIYSCYNQIFISETSSPHIVELRYSKLLRLGKRVRLQFMDDTLNVHTSNPWTGNGNSWTIRGGIIHDTVLAFADKFPIDTRKMQRNGGNVKQTHEETDPLYSKPEPIYITLDNLAEHMKNNPNEYRIVESLSTKTAARRMLRIADSSST